MTKKGRSKSSISGQSLVEFAFVLPILLLLMVAMIDFGILYYSQMVVSNAAWEGARAG
ncbi:MAG: pilus assembly protein, partial [Anaerolineales bacterium]|nr:pilus assembly protein [Anaerolineales bacterium]